MPGHTKIALLAGVFAIAIGGCGSGDNGTIPPQNSEELLQMLAQVESLVETGDCTVAVGPVTELTDAINELPDDVDSKVQSELTKGASNLLAQIKDPENCPEGATGGTGVETTEATTTETSTTETSTTTVPEETSTVEETTEEPPTEEPTQGNEEPPTGNNGQGPQGNQGGGPAGGGPTSGGVDVPGGKR
jgi:hypothetical protein